MGTPLRKKVAAAKARAAKQGTPCMAFALCANAAVTSIANPILGAVPACKRCAERLGAL